MGDDALPAINEVAFFLRKHAPAAVGELATRGEEYREVTKLGIVGGKYDVDDSIRRRQLLVRAEVLASALVVAVETSARQCQLITKQLRTLRQLRFWAGVAAAITSSGVVVAASLAKQLQTVLLSSLSLLSSVLTVASETLILGSGRKEIDLISIGQSLSKSSAYASLTQQTLSGMLRIEFELDEITTLLKQANQSFSELNEALSKIAH